MRVGSLVKVARKDTPYIWSCPLEVDNATSVGRFNRGDVGLIIEMSEYISDSGRRKICREVKVQVAGVVGWVSTDYLVEIDESR